MSTTMIANVSARTSPAGRPDAQPAQRALVGAPLGTFPLLEAAFAWHERRPSGWNRVAVAISPAKYVPIAQLREGAAAQRLARLLSTLTWTAVTRVELPTGSIAHLPQWRVEVSANSYHRVTRALMGAWRDRGRLLAAPDPRQAATGLWRVATLIGLYDPRLASLTIKVNTSATAMTLAAAAGRLGLTPAIDLHHGSAAHTFRITGTEQIHRLVAVTAGLP